MNIVRIQKARKKPVEVEFIQYDGENGQALYDWSNSQIRSVWYPASGESELTVETLEGFLIISINDYVIKDVDGEF
ncbi:hypothetical protein, partial [Staphylococcus xylosus]|uniref:hypothetical protein n=1 Tax=Staphylococcus xylosus TaxID=1288 RepID=UPI0015F91F05